MITDIPSPGGSTAKARKTNLLTKCMFGRFKTYTPSDAAKAFTTNFGMELETGFDAVRFGFVNMHTAAITGAKFSVAVTNKNHTASYVQDSAPSTGEWIDGVFPNCPARVSADLPSVTWSDWVDIQDIPQLDTSRPRPILMGRIEIPAGAVATIPLNGFANWNDLTITKRMMRAVSQAVDGVTTKGNWVGGVNPNNLAMAPTSYANAMIPIVQYLTRVPGKQVMLVGDSTLNGVGATVKDFGAIPMACTDKSTPDAPIEYFNAGMHSLGQAVYSRAIDLYSDVVRPTHVFYQPWSVNDSAVGGHTDLMIRSLKGTAARVVAKLQSLPALPDIFWMEPLPCTTAFKNLGDGDAKRRDFMTQFLPLLKAGTVVPGYAAKVTGAVVAGQTQPVAALMFDGAHPNDAGYAELAAPVKPLL